MRKRVLCFGVVLLALSVNAQNKPEVIFTGTPWGVQGISENGRYICGTRMYEEAYRFDIQEGRLFVEPVTNTNSDMGFLDVANDGTLFGTDNDMYAAYYKDGQWQKLPVPDGSTGGSVMACSAEGDVLTGLAEGQSTTETPYAVSPMVWRKQADGAYAYEVLPVPEKDFLGGTPQWVSPRAISSDGNTVVAVMAEEYGFFFQQVIYRYENGAWTYELPFVDLAYNMDCYQEYQDKKPQMSDYITTQPGDAEYKEQVNHYQILYAQWQYEWYSHWKTGTTFIALPIVLSEDGKLLASAMQKESFSYQPGDVEVTTESYFYPALYNLETKEYTELPDAKGWTVTAISNEGDIITTDYYDFYLIPHGWDNVINITDYLKQEYDFDLAAALPSNTEYMECEAISKDMSVLAGLYVSVTPDGELDSQEVFCVLLPGMSSIIKTLNVPSSELVRACEDRLCFSDNASDIHVYDMVGKEVLAERSETVDMSIATLPMGVYVVRAVVAGQEVKAKFYKR